MLRRVAHWLMKEPDLEEEDLRASVVDGRIEIDPMITHVLPLERINEAFELMHRGESIRSVIVY